jgi:hypothetical protein
MIRLQNSAAHPAAKRPYLRPMLKVGLPASAKTIVAKMEGFPATVSAEEPVPQK